MKMDIINQFPDVSMKMRDKLKSRRKSYQWKNANAEIWKNANTEITFDKDLVETRFYNNEFKKWHIKLVFIIALGITSIYIIASNIRWLFI